MSGFVILGVCLKMMFSISLSYRKWVLKVHSSSFICSSSAVYFDSSFLFENLENTINT